MLDHDLEPVHNADGQLIGFQVPAPPRFRYFQDGRGPMFCWTTERFAGHYGSLVLVPVGEGSRTNKAEEWETVEDSISAHELRKDAKARAVKLYEDWKAGNPKPWA